MVGWTGRWVLERIRADKHVEQADLLLPQRLHVTRRDLPELFIDTISVERVDAAVLQPFVAQTPAPSFVVNVSRESYTVGSALSLAAQCRFGIGGMGELIRALGVADVRDIISKDIEFLLRGLNQHSAVRSVERLDDRRFRIRRCAHPEMVVVCLPAYEMLADHVRTARDRYGNFDVVVASNPNGSVAASADQAAESMGLEIYKWGPFLGRLNRA